jgi:transcriptional regulator with XRE-family HTH domain
VNRTIQGTTREKTRPRLKGATDEERERWRALGRRLRHLRERAGLSQRDVADELGLYRPAVTLIEAGLQRVDALRLVGLARLYGTTPDDVLGFLVDERGREGA